MTGRPEKRDSIAVTIYEGTSRGKRIFTVCYYEGRDRKRLTRSTLEKAKETADNIINRILAGDRDSIEISSRDRELYDRAQRRVEGTGYDVAGAVDAFVAGLEKLGGRGSIAEAVEFYVANCPEDVHRVSVFDAVTEFLAEKKAEVKPKSYSASYGYRLPQFRDAFNTDLQEVTEADLKRWIEALKVTEAKRGKGKVGGALGNQTRRHYLANIKTLFIWAREKEKPYLPPIQKTAAEKLWEKTSKKKGQLWPIATRSPDIFTAEQMTTLLEGCREDLIPYAALLAFGALRPSEALRLQWENIKWDDDYIEVTPEIAEKKNGDRFIPLQPNLRAWLAPYREDSGPINWATSDKLLAADAIELGVCDFWPEDVLRHSHATARLAVTQNRAMLAEEMGNSVDVIKAHYRRPMTEERGKEWFTISPKT